MSRLQLGLLASFVLLVASAAPIRAEAPGMSEPPEVREGPQFAVGSSLAWQYRRDFGTATRAAFAPELFATLAMKSPWPRVFFRPALRLGFVGIGQAEQPKAIKIAERDIVGEGELSLIYDGPVIPSLTFGGGGVIRFLALKLDDQIDAGASDETSRTQALARIYTQVGVGLPIRGGTIVFEPNLRYEVAFGDDRLAWRAGLDISYALSRQCSVRSGANRPSALDPRAGRAERPLGLPAWRVEARS